MSVGLLRLGSRLASGAATGERFRPVAVLLSGLVSTIVLLHVFAGSNASMALNALISIQVMDSLRWVVLLGVGLPALALVATTARLSALARDRRLARLQLLGLTPWQTRLVAVTETSALLLVGTIIGVVGYLSTRSLAADLWADTAEFPAAHYRAGVGGLVAVAAVMVTALVIAAVQVRSNSSAALRVDRIGGRPRWLWRLAVLAVGSVCVVIVVVRVLYDSVGRFDLVVFVIGASLTAAGVLLTAPLVTWLFGHLLLQIARTGSVRLAARRLQFQPAGSTRVASSMIVALFMLALVQPLTSSFYTDPVAREDRVAATTGPQFLRVALPDLEALPEAERVLRSNGVTRVELATVLDAEDCEMAEFCVSAFVGTCWSLTIDLLVPDCGDEAAWLGQRAPGASDAIRLVSPDGGGPPLSIHSPDRVLSTTVRSTSLMGEDAALFVPRDLPGVTTWLVGKPVDVIVEGPGGLGVEWRLADALRPTIPEVRVHSTRAFANYVTARNIVTVLDAIRVSVVVIGLLTFLLASIEQVLARQTTARSLLLIGVGRSTLRCAQLLESLVPLMISLPAAIGLGYLTGVAYVGLSGASATWTSLSLVPIVAIAGTILVSTVLLVLAVPRITPATVRRV